jgi:hypothetical protein
MAAGANAEVESWAVSPSRMTMAEKTKMEEKGLTAVRLSCQIVCDHDMTVRAISRLTGSGRVRLARRVSVQAVV